MLAAHADIRTPVIRWTWSKLSSILTSLVSCIRIRGSAGFAAHCGPSTASQKTPNFKPACPETAVRQRRNARASNAEMFSRHWRRSLLSSSRSMGRSASSPSGPRPTFPGKATKAISAIADVVSSWTVRRKSARRLSLSLHQAIGNKLYVGLLREAKNENATYCGATRPCCTRIWDPCMRSQGQAMLLLAVLHKCQLVCRC